MELNRKNVHKYSLKFFPAEKKSPADFTPYFVAWEIHKNVLQEPDPLWSTVESEPSCFLRKHTLN